MNARFRIDKRGEAARYALAARRGAMRADALHGMSRDMYETLTEAELEEMTPPVRRGGEDSFNNVPV